MQRMSGIDPMFVYADTPATPMEVVYACVLDPTSVPGGYSFQRVRDLLTARVPALPALRRRLMAVPFGLDVPRLVDDPESRPLRPPVPRRVARAGRTGGVRAEGVGGDEPPAPTRPASVGDARDRGAGRRPCRLDRQGPPRRRRWCRGRAAHGPIARPGPGRTGKELGREFGKALRGCLFWGQWRHRDAAVLAARPPAFRGEAPHGCLAELRDEPVAGVARRA